MIKQTSFGLLVVIGLAFTQQAAGQQWVQQLFPTKKHDFGVVPRAAKAEHHFTVTNTLKQDLHLSSVRASCGCASPSIVKKTIKPGETGAIFVRFNSRSFLGKRRATITVTVAKPRYAEVQLVITGYVRRDVVLNPGKVDFGEVSPSGAGEKKIQIRYAGKPQWKILDVKSTNPLVHTEWIEVSRSGGQIEYDMSIRLDEHMKPGDLREELVLSTNDRLSDVRVMVEGRVLSPLTVSPASVFMGIIKQGDQSTKQLVVRASTPFRVTNIECDDPCFQFGRSDEAKKLHLIPVTFTAGDLAAPKINQKVLIQTDLEGGLSASCILTAAVRLDQVD